VDVFYGYSDDGLDARRYTGPPRTSPWHKRWQKLLGAPRAAVPCLLDNFLFPAARCLI
jgi:hypothetical protein